ncbi:MAG: ZIP family metal transporter [Candidatus Omnitrophica bacterium]|nr:ZIP family metal transporter [Candidatus Omnitrophota bacterium]HOX54520.1 ZIP family metal transporter [Candidatus Omnitrophota bacterium]
MVLFWIIGATFLVSLISFIGVITFVIKGKLLDKLLFALVGFSAGALIGGAFFHLMPEALENSEAEGIFVYFVLGIVVFLMLERFFHWRHCHEGICEIHAFTYLNLIGDGIHNFIDGAVIAVSFLISFNLGIITTMAVILHEIPQELGDFGVLVYGGFSKARALFFNFLSAITALGGALTAYLFANVVKDISSGLLAFTAGGFIYIASSDLIPEIHKQKDNRKANIAFLLFIAGLVFMWLGKHVGH